MSTIVKFFSALPAEVSNISRSGPGASLSVVTYGNFDAEEALLEWESRLTGETFEELVNNDIPEVVCESDNGPIVVKVSIALQSALSATSGYQLDELAKWWIGGSSQSGSGVNLDIALRILMDLRDLVCQDRRPGDDVYCWMA